MTAPPAGALEACLALLPCPGCGGTRTRTIGGPGTKGGPKYWAGCDVCHWRTWGDTESDAIAAWNRRTDAAALRLREGFYWIKDSDWNQIVLEMPTGEDGYAQGYQDAMSAVTRGLCVGPNPAANSLPAPPTADDLARVLEETK